MKKISKILLIFSVSLFLVLAFAPVVNAASSADQQCVLVGSDYDLISPATTPREQSFIPTQNRLEMVHTWLNGPGFTGDQSVVVNILNSSKTLIGSNTYSPTFSTEEPQIRTAEFSPALTLIPGQIYYIQIDVLDGPNNLYWYRSIGDCYADGTAYGEGVAYPWDFLFQTYGSAYTEPSNPSTPSTTTPSNTSTSSTTPSNTSATTTGQTTTAAPKTTTSTSVAVPSNPQAAYDDINKSAFFSWKASTTADIEGYIISRSEDGTTFTDLGAVSKEITSYSDKNIANGKTYYYQVKAYKGTLASPASVVVSVAIPEAVTQTAADLKAEDTKKDGFFTTQNILLLSAGLLILVLAIILVTQFYLRKKNMSLRDLFKKKQKTE